MQVQTRSENNGLRLFDTLKEAFEHAKNDETVWKISFVSANGEAVRLVRANSPYGLTPEVVTWTYAPMESLKNLLSKEALLEAAKEGQKLGTCDED